MTPPAATQTTKSEPSSRMFRATICVQTRVGAVRDCSFLLVEPVLATAAVRVGVALDLPFCGC
jgi:hypothetical protein